MSLAHIATLYAVINIYTVHNSYSSAWKFLTKWLKDTLSKLKHLKCYKVTKSVINLKTNREKVYPPPFPHKSVL